MIIDSMIATRTMVAKLDEIATKLSDIAREAHELPDDASINMIVGTLDSADILIAKAAALVNAIAALRK